MSASSLTRAFFEVSGGDNTHELVIDSEIVETRPTMYGARIVGRHAANFWVVIFISKQLATLLFISFSQTR